MLHDLHRSLLQRLMHAGALSEKAALALLRDLVEFYQPQLAKVGRYKSYTRSSVSAATVEECVSAINKELEFFAMKVAKAHHAAERTFYYALVNLQHDDLALKAHTFSPAQVDFFAKMRAAIEAEEGDDAGLGSITTTDATNVRLQLAKELSLDANAATATLEKLLDAKWLQVGNDGDDVLILGPRAVIQAQF